jgi:hypothetical protein
MPASRLSDGIVTCQVTAGTGVSHTFLCSNTYEKFRSCIHVTLDVTLLQGKSGISLDRRELNRRIFSGLIICEIS